MPKNWLIVGIGIRLLQPRGLRAPEYFGFDWPGQAPKLQTLRHPAVRS
jgi:hypothetical protein